MSRVVAVAAPIGGGKSALVAALAQALGNAPTLHFDEFELATRFSPLELNSWLESGADFNSIPAPGFVEALRGLADSNSEFPAAERPSDYIVVELPLGRAFAATAGLVDILIWVDTPLDLALARNLRSLAAEAIEDSSQRTEEFLEWLVAYLDSYGELLHPILELQRRRVCPDADLILDGRLPIDELVNLAIERIKTICGEG